MTTDTLTVASWNVERNGIDPDGGRRRRDVALEVLREVNADLVFRQEEHFARDNDGRLADEEADVLGLETHLSPYGPEHHSPQAVLVRPELFQFEREDDWYSGLYKPIRIVTVRMRGTTRPLKLTSVHLCWCDPGLRETAARRLTALADQGKASAMVFMDGNSYPSNDPASIAPLPSWEEIPDPVHRAHRFITRDGKRVPDTVPDEVLTGSGVFEELGYYAYSQRGQREALRPTGSLWRKDQGPRRRIDRGYVTTDLAPALRSLEVIDEPRVAFASDHALVVATFDMNTLRRALTDTPPAVAEAGPVPAVAA